MDKPAEAGAQIASDRYTQFSGVIADLKGKINDDIIKAAEEKLAAAKAAADLCLKKP